MAGNKVALRFEFVAIVRIEIKIFLNIISLCTS